MIWNQFSENGLHLFNEVLQLLELEQVEESLKRLTETETQAEIILVNNLILRVL